MGLQSSLKLGNGIGGGRGDMDSSVSLSDSKALSHFPVCFEVWKLELVDPV